MQITIFTSIFESRPNMELEIGRSLLQQQKKSGLSEQEGPGGPLPPPTYPPTQISADQLTLSQSGGRLCPPHFQTFLRPYSSRMMFLFSVVARGLSIMKPWKFVLYWLTGYVVLCTLPPRFFVYQNLSHSLQIFWNASINMPLARLDFSNQTFFFSFF